MSGSRSKANKQRKDAPVERRNGDSQATGQRFEDKTVELLKAQGFRIVTTNFRSRGGEIDIIATDDHQLLFVEVRVRRSSRYGSAAATVNAKKQCKIARCAACFLQKHPRWNNRPCRFDVIAWEPLDTSGWEPREASQRPQEHYIANWIPGAFLG
mgnify:CR=1 FL=1